MPYSETLIIRCGYGFSEEVAERVKILDVVSTC